MHNKFLFVLIWLPGAVLAQSGVLYGLPPLPGDEITTHPVIVTPKPTRRPWLMPPMMAHTFPPPQAMKPVDHLFAVNPVPELPPIPESRLDGHYNDDGDFVPNHVPEHRDNKIHGVKIEQQQPFADDPINNQNRRIAASEASRHQVTSKPRPYARARAVHIVTVSPQLSKHRFHDVDEEESIDEGFGKTGLGPKSRNLLLSGGDENIDHAHVGRRGWSTRTTTSIPQVVVPTKRLTTTSPSPNVPSLRQTPQPTFRRGFQQEIVHPRIIPSPGHYPPPQQVPQQFVPQFIATTLPPQPYNRLQEDANYLSEVEEYDWHLYYKQLALEQQAATKNGPNPRFTFDPEDLAALEQRERFTDFAPQKAFDIARPPVKTADFHIPETLIPLETGPTGVLTSSLYQPQVPPVPAVAAAVPTQSNASPNAFLDGLLGYFHLPAYGG